MNKKTVGRGLIVLGCLFVVFAFVLKQQRIDLDSPADKLAKQLGGTVYEAEAQIASFGKSPAEAREITREIISKGIAEEVQKKQRRLKAEEAKEQGFYILLSVAGVTVLSGIIILINAKSGKITA